ncbi:hypothetical protein [Rhodococcus koreensis]|uniref:hypothetical protein n=1 Tax=Rhodococcus koreensis TaxID=99653 RepID=UPI0036D97A5E
MFEVRAAVARLTPSHFDARIINRVAFEGKVLWICDTDPTLTVAADAGRRAEQ